MHRLSLPIVFVLALASPAARLEAEHQVVAPPGPGLDLPFSPGILSDDFLFLSGAIANKPGSTRVEGDVSEQVRATMENLGKVLEAAGLDFSRVVASHVYLADARHFDTMNEVYGGYFDDERPPTRTTVEADIAIPDAEMEIGMIAARSHLDLEWIVPEGWQKSPNYGWAVKAGDTLFLSGMVSSDPRTGNLVPGDFATQARQTLANVRTVLEAAGMGAANVATCEVYLSDARDYAAMNEIYGEVFSSEPPARATVRARLAHPALSIEVSCIAAAGEREIVRPFGEEPSSRPLSAAIQIGDRLFLSGMVGRRGTQYPTDVEGQTRIALERLRQTLLSARMTWREVESATVYLTDIRHYQAMNAVYREVIPDPPPARATVGTQLMSPEALVEIQMIASKKR